MADLQQTPLTGAPSTIVPQVRDAAAEEMQAFMGSLRPFWWRAMLYIVLLFVGIAVVWAWWGEVDVVASAPFQLVPMGKVKTLQAPRGGEIEHIGVREGNRIEEGQLLFKLKSWETWGDLRELEQAEMAYQQAEYDFEQVLSQRTELNRETIASLKKGWLCCSGLWLRIKMSSRNTTPTWVTLQDPEITIPRLNCRRRSASGRRKSII